MRDSVRGGVAVAMEPSMPFGSPCTNFVLFAARLGIGRQTHKLKDISGPWEVTEAQPRRGLDLRRENLHLIVREQRGWTL